MIRKLTVLLLFLAGAASAQETGPQMADAFRQEGKIYVVIAVVAMIFAALLVFMIYLERKVKKLEDKINKS